MQLSEHFSLEEFVSSQVASRKGIDNDPPALLFSVLKRTAEGMEGVRAFLGFPIRISSGYRCEALERELTYSSYLARCKLRGIPVNDTTWAQYFSEKSHPKGEAVDFTCSQYGDPRKIVTAIMKSDIAFDQLLCEFDSWTHISFGDKNRRQVLVIDSSGARNFS
jgi:hypothetical protein